MIGKARKTFLRIRATGATTRSTNRQGKKVVPEPRLVKPIAMISCALYLCSELVDLAYVMRNNIPTALVCEYPPCTSSTWTGYSQRACVNLGCHLALASLSCRCKQERHRDELDSSLRFGANRLNFLFQAGFFRKCSRLLQD